MLLSWNSTNFSLWYQNRVIAKITTVYDTKDRLRLVFRKIHLLTHFCRERWRSRFFAVKNLLLISKKGSVGNFVTLRSNSFKLYQRSAQQFLIFNLKIVLQSVFLILVWKIKWSSFQWYIQHLIAFIMWIGNFLWPKDLFHQNYYSISHLLGTVTTQWLDGVVTVVNCRQHGDNTADQLYSHRAAGSCQQWLQRHCVVTVSKI